MKMIDRQTAGVTIVDISGRLVLGEGTAQLRTTIRELIASGKPNILLDLTKVPFIDSCGIGELVSALTAARHAGGEVKLLGLTRKVRDVLQIVKLVTVFETFDDEILALRAFARDKETAPDFELLAG